ncbi:MAG TPA: PilZ domain-containing protein [Thermoanaerobaculia bacterium]
MTRRISPRRPRRVQVQFWKRGEPHAYPGYTTNISLTGMFIGTRSPFPPGTRLRIEVPEGDRGFMVEGVVAHARKVRGELMRLSQPGMGVRFLSVEDLVRELVPSGYGQEDLPPAHAEPLPPIPPLPEGAVEREPLWDPVPSIPELPAVPVAAAPTPSPIPASRPPEPIPTPREGGGTFAVHFLNQGEFLDVYRRDIVNGGLFVSTRYPGRLQETVNVELHPPFPNARPVLVRARVVQRFEPSGDLLSPNLLAGMGVELLDLASVVESLQPYVQGA